jgi:hypothetical protein
LKKNCTKQYKEPNYNWNKEDRTPISSLGTSMVKNRKGTCLVASAFDYYASAYLVTFLSVS